MKCCVKVNKIMWTEKDWVFWLITLLVSAILSLANSGREKVNTWWRFLKHQKLSLEENRNISFIIMK